MINKLTLFEQVCVLFCFACLLICCLLDPLSVLIFFLYYLSLSFFLYANVTKRSAELAASCVIVCYADYTSMHAHLCILVNVCMHACMVRPDFCKNIDTNTFFLTSVSVCD